jgi:hypothetical protein
LVTASEKERQRRFDTLYPETPLSVYYLESERQWESIAYHASVESMPGADVVGQISRIRYLQDLGVL